MPKLHVSSPDRTCPVELTDPSVSSLLLRIVENALPATDDPILTVEQVAADLSVSRRTLYDWVHKGIIEPPQKLGLRRVGYRRSAIERFKAARPLAFVPKR